MAAQHRGVLHPELYEQAESQRAGSLYGRGGGLQVPLEVQAGLAAERLAGGRAWHRQVGAEDDLAGPTPAKRDARR